MYPIPPNEHLIETKVCKHCEQSFPITDKDALLLERLSPIIGGNTYKLPNPEMCPDCRKIQRLAWRNEKNIFKRKCDFTGKDIISIFPPDSPHKVYDEDVWNSDAWNPRDYALDFDFSRSFLEQFQELLLQVPVSSKSSLSCENSDYCNACTSIKDSYLTFSANTSENILYSVDMVNTKSCVDCLTVVDSENCYECIVTTRCYNIEHSYDVKDCRDSKFLLSCDGCSDCYACYNLTNAQFHIYNIPYTKEEYEKELMKLNELSLPEQKKQFEVFYGKGYKKLPLPVIGSENVVESQNVFNSQNVAYSKHIRGAQNIRYCQKMQVPPVNLSMDYTGFGSYAEKIYFSQQIGNHATGIYFSVGTFGEVSDIYYSVNCRNGVHNCFGCVGLRQASYSILNRQYTKEEYEQLVPKIIEHMIQMGEWGEFFPAKMSLYGYNHTVCQILSPLEKEEALSHYFNWSDYEPPFPKVEKIIPAKLLPENIDDIPDDILNWAVECEVTKKPFRIIKQELDFYRKHHLPVPRKHPDQRYLDKLKWHVNY